MLPRIKPLSFSAVLPAITAVLLLAGCGDVKDLKQIPEYKGPLSEVRDLEMLFSDSARIKIHLKAPLQTEKANGDRLFPEGVYVEFFDEKGAKKTTLKANKGIRYANNIYNVTGNVIVNNIEKGETLNTEELNWKPDNKTIYTEKFVTITTDDEILKGEGLDAAQDFSRYSIRKPTGIFPLKQTATDEAN